MATTPSRSRVPLVGAALGVALLLAVVMLAVVLPRLDGGAASGAEGARVTLPAEVGGFTAQSSGGGETVEGLRERLQSAAQRVEDVYGVPVSVELYSGPAPEGAGGGGQEAQPSSAVVTALSAPAGLFLPSGPAPDPELLGLARNQSDLERVGDAVCNVVYAQPVQQGQEVDPAEVPSSLQCQLTTDDGLTFQVDGGGMTAETAVGLLDDLAAAQG